MGSSVPFLQRSLSLSDCQDSDLHLTGIPVPIAPAQASHTPHVDVGSVCSGCGAREGSPTPKIGKACPKCQSNESRTQTPKSNGNSPESPSKKVRCVPPNSCQYVIRWPSECQVLPYRIRHIKSLPSSPEIFYEPNGKEAQPRPIGEDHGVTVYHYKPTSQVNYFSRSVPGGSPSETFQEPVRRNLDHDCLIFESRFESGNLEKAVRITDTYYELYLRPDFYTSRHCQWYYFQIQNMKTDVKYRFSIVNFSKPDSLYNCGMKPVLYSKIEADRHFVGWTRVGDHIRYYKNDMPQEEEEAGPTYTLTFTISFPHTGDTVYLAHCYPYRYSDLTEDLMSIQSNPARAQYCSQRLLCRTLAGNNVYILTITSPDTLEDSKGKICVVLSARVHPGETPSSWMMRGVIQYLTGSTDTARALRERFVFKIVPMLNPDGVIIGNTRCNLAGRDLNRQYKNVIKEAFPPVYQTKMMIKKLLEEGTIAMYCDFHAHSRKFNIFMYGCENRRHSDKFLKEQIFPLMLHKNAADKFSFEGCKFTIQRSKESTGRVVFWNMGIMNSFTLEASYGGSNLGTRAFTHFTTGDYQSLGRYFCETLFDFCDPDPPKEQLRHKMLQKLIKEESNAVEPVNIAITDYSSLSSSGVSESEEENIEEMVGDSVTIARKSLIKRRRKKMKTRDNFYSTNYSEYLRPENYTVDAQESMTKKAVEELPDNLENNTAGECQANSVSDSENSPARNSLMPDLVVDFKTLSMDSGESTSAEDVNDDLDYLNLVFQEPSLNELDPEILMDDTSSFDGQPEFSAMSCERVHSEILASVNRIRSSIINNRKNFLPCQKSSIEGNVAQTSEESTPAKVKAKSQTKGKKVTTKSTQGPEDTPAVKPKKKKRGSKSKNSTPINSGSKKKDQNSSVDGKSEQIYATPLRARTFYRRAGNITKLEVFLQQDTKKKKKKRPDSGTGKQGTAKESGAS